MQFYNEFKNAIEGICAAHHHQHFDIDEDALKFGAAATYAIEYIKADGLPGGRLMTHRELLESLERFAEAEEFYGK